MVYSCPKPQGNGPLVEVFPDVWAVEGRVTMGPGMSITRNMTIIRQGSELAIVNSVRLMPKEEKELEQLGTVKHLVRLCEDHGMDDPYFAERYKPTVWVSGEGMGWSKEAGLKAEKVLGKDGAPFPELIEPVIMSKDYLKVPGDASLIVKKQKGILVASDSIMCYGNRKQDLKLSNQQDSLMAKPVLWMMGFSGRIITPPLFFKHHSCNGQASGVMPELKKLAAADWDAIIPCHGLVIKDGAKVLYSKWLDAKFKSAAATPPATATQ
uniref:Metallo-beta-lactamase domain-containing protein n=1 Tax=Chlamydomonas euryale TaxID=1486919 RepID=A0A7R9Z1L1_9CHLO|mmetsp:Transcript_40871/g.122015  ORF Transcript_40871/g.122015 Transcript_40871/m.122015 type:complete len:267 (+) Transcript_40871:102-902(+)